MYFLFSVQTWRTVGFRGSHSLRQSIKMNSMTINILPALQDNYMYLVSINNRTVVQITI